MVGIRIHRRSTGFLSAMINNIPQEKATAATRPMGYTNSVSPTRSGNNTDRAIPKSAIAAVQ